MFHQIGLLSNFEQIGLLNWLFALVIKYVQTSDTCLIAIGCLRADCLFQPSCKGNCSFSQCGCSTQILKEMFSQWAFFTQIAKKKIVVLFPMHWKKNIAMRHRFPPNNWRKIGVIAKKAIQIRLQITGAWFFWQKRLVCQWYTFETLFKEQLLQIGFHKHFSLNTDFQVGLYQNAFQIHMSRLFLLGSLQITWGKWVYVHDLKPFFLLSISQTDQNDAHTDQHLQLHIHERPTLDLWGFLLQVFPNFLLQVSSNIVLQVSPNIQLQYHQIFYVSLWSGVKQYCGISVTPWASG